MNLIEELQEIKQNLKDADSDKERAEIVESAVMAGSIDRFASGVRDLYNQYANKQIYFETDAQDYIINVKLSG